MEKLDTSLLTGILVVLVLLLINTYITGDKIDDLTESLQNRSATETVVENSTDAKETSDTATEEPYHTLSEYRMADEHPYVKDYDLVELGCPICNYQLYTWGSSGTSAVAKLKCTNCSWESKEVHIEHCDSTITAKQMALDLYTAGDLTKDIEFEYPVELYTDCKRSLNGG